MQPNPTGQHLPALEQALGDKAGFEIAFTLATPKTERLAFHLTCYTYSTAVTTTPPGTRQLRSTRWPTVLAELAGQHPDAVPCLDTLVVRGVKRPAEVRRLLGLALCELFGRPAPDEKELARQRKAVREAGEARTAERALALRRPDGVAAWNALRLAERKGQGRFDRVDLSGARLAGIDLTECSALAANFAGATLADATLTRAVLRRADLTGASLRRAKLPRADLAGVRAAGANLAEARLVNVRLDGADLRGANLRGVSLHQATLFDADLTDADLTDAVAGRTRYNAGTTFPAGFTPGREWVFFGPGLPVGVGSRRPALDFDGLLARLRKVVPERSLQAAKALLGVERLQLFAEVEDGHLAGVVRSRFLPGRLNACRLTAEGCFCCGSVRLRSCSSQGGAVCGHLLALVLGLVRAGRFDAGRAYLWLRRASRRTTVADRPGLVSTLLRYKGAEAGAVDWRPTETLPEDYYAL